MKEKMFGAMEMILVAPKDAATGINHATAMATPCPDGGIYPQTGLLSVEDQIPVGQISKNLKRITYLQMVPTGLS